MQQYPLGERPTEGEVVAVYNSPGPGDLIRFDISVQFSIGSILFQQVRPVNVPYSLSVPPYDVIGAPPESNCQISWRGDEARFWVPWLPDVSLCTGVPG